MRRAHIDLFVDPTKAVTSPDQPRFGKWFDTREKGIWSHEEDERVFRDAKEKLRKLVDDEVARLDERARILRLPLAIRQRAKPVLIARGAKRLDDRRFFALVSRCDPRSLVIWVQEDNRRPEWCAHISSNQCLHEPNVSPF